MELNHPATQRTVGIIGGIGPESTVDYYKGIISSYRRLHNNGDYPRIIINSINMTEMLSLIETKDYSGVTGLLLRSVTALKNAGADIAAIASNTPHVIFDQLQPLTPIPLISIVEATCQHAVSLGLKKLLLIGTRFTMENHFYQEVFDNHSIHIVVPGSDDRNAIHNIIFPELEEGIVRPEKKVEMIALCNKIITQESCEGIILGCTELPLMLHPEDFEITVLNTTLIHVNAIAEKIFLQ